MTYSDMKGVPDFKATAYENKNTKYCICIPIINENGRIINELKRAQKAGVHKLCDIVICDGGSTDGSTEDQHLKSLGVNTLLVKTGPGKQGAQLRAGFWWALQRGYKGIITIDGNDKDSIEDVPLFIEKLDQGYDLIQGSRYLKGGKAINTPIYRHLAVKSLHAPLISFAAKYRFTDTTNAFRGYSRKYLIDPRVQPFRDVFSTYELLAYLSVRASQIGLKVIEVPVTRRYPKNEVPTKISPLKGSWQLLKILIATLFGQYNPPKRKKK